MTRAEVIALGREMIDEFDIAISEDEASPEGPAVPEVIDRHKRMREALQIMVAFYEVQGA